MQLRPLGRSSLFVSPLGLGCVTFGREIDEAASIALMHHAVDHGVNFFDTAQLYANGESERIVGRWLRQAGRRDKIVLATKVKGDMSGPGIARAVDASLASLQTDRVDLFYLHTWPNDDHPLEETLAALDRAVRQGKVRALGVSNAAAWQLCRALWLADVRHLARFDAVQPAYSLADRRIERELLPLCTDQSVAAVTYSPLAAGFLTGKYAAGGPIPPGSRFDIKPGHQRIYFHDRCFATLQKLHELAAQSNQSPAHLALAWVLARPGVTTVLVGGRSPAHLDQAFAAAGNLSPEILAALDAASLPNA